MQENKQYTETTNESTFDIINAIPNDNKYNFNHLNDKNCSYFEHFKHAMYYSLVSLKASFYFFIHAFIPDLFTESGSTTINGLNHVISNHAYTDADINVDINLERI